MSDTGDRPDSGPGMDGPTTRQMARSLGGLYTCGALLALTWTLLPHEDSTGDAVVVAMAVTSLSGGLLMLSGLADRAPVLLFHVVIGCVQVAISVAYVAAVDPGNDIRWFYVWATPFAAFFFSRRAATLHALWVAALMAAALLLQDAPLGRAGSVWAMSIGTVGSATALVGWAAAGMRASGSRSRHASLHDPLTGLANRRLFERATQAALDRRDRDGGSVQVLLIDLDAFKLVNDTYGHHAGDDLLVLVARRMVNGVRSGDTVARLGGDESAIVCDDPNGALDLQRTVERLQLCWAMPFDLHAGTVYTSGSTGVARAEGVGADAESLLREADAAMYRAKATGRGGYAVYDAGMRHQDASRLQLDRALHEALARGQLWVAYQPIVDLGCGRVRGAEALLRWTHPQLGQVPPSEFIPVAEENGLIVPLGLWVLDQVAGQLAAWRSAAIVAEDFTVSVNVSARQINAGLAREVAELQARHRLPTGALVIELTESVLLDDGPGPAAVLQQLRHQGVPLYLDDFGTGYSALSYLARIPLSAIKIDRSFVADLTTSTSREPVVLAIISMAHALDLRVVAEGVETPEQQDRLRRLGCELAQGYLLGRPVPPAGFAARLLEPVHIARPVSAAG